MVYHGTDELQQMRAIEQPLYQLMILNCWVMGGCGSMYGTGLKRQRHGDYIRVGQSLFAKSTETIQYFNVNATYLPIEQQLYLIH